MPKRWCMRKSLAGTTLFLLMCLLSLHSTQAVDSDRDGVPDDQDLYPFDYDNDEIPDTWESQNSLQPSVSDSLDDSDNDGLSNWEEFQSETDPTSVDSDGDGMSDLDEIRTGRDPLVPEHLAWFWVGIVLVIVVLAAGGWYVYTRLKTRKNQRTLIAQRTANQIPQSYSHTSLAQASQQPSTSRSPAHVYPAPKSKEEALKKLESFSGRDK